MPTVLWLPLPANRQHNRKRERTLLLFCSLLIFRAAGFLRTAALFSQYCDAFSDLLYACTPGAKCDIYHSADCPLRGKRTLGRMQCEIRFFEKMEPVQRQGAVPVFAHNLMKHRFFRGENGKTKSCICAHEMCPVAAFRFFLDLWMRSGAGRYGMIGNLPPYTTVPHGMRSHPSAYDRIRPYTTVYETYQSKDKNKSENKSKEEE